MCCRSGSVQIRNFLVKLDQYPEESLRIRIQVCLIFANLYVKIVQFLFDYINTFRYLEQLLNAFNVLLQSHVVSTSKICQLLTWPSLRVGSGSVLNHSGSPHTATSSAATCMYQVYCMYSKLLVSYILYSYI